MDNTQKILDLEQQIMELTKEKQRLEATNGVMHYIYTDFNESGELLYCDITLLGAGGKKIAEAFAEYKEKLGYKRSYINTFHTTSKEEYKVLRDYMDYKKISYFLRREVSSDACRDVVEDVSRKYRELGKKVKKMLKERFDERVDAVRVYKVE